MTRGPLRPTRTDPHLPCTTLVRAKNYPPGMHGTSRRRGNQSEYSLQLMEKQKAKYTYGLLERQFARLFNKASRKDGVTGELLLKYLEARLDNTDRKSVV